MALGQWHSTAVWDGHSAGRAAQRAVNALQVGAVLTAAAASAGTGALVLTDAAGHLGSGTAPLCGTGT